MPKVVGLPLDTVDYRVLVVVQSFSRVTTMALYLFAPTRAL